jgi:hypothetical protein
VPLRRLLFPAVLCIAALAPAAVAQADTEPNNALVQAEGPISGGVTVAGSLGAPDDEDWYVFYVQGQQQIHLTSTPDKTNTNCGNVYLTDTDGQSVADDFTTPPGTNRYFARVSNFSSYCQNTSYTFKLNPAAALVSGPATKQAQPTGEPNETKDQPAGPLEGGVPYSGSLDTSNDEDWFYFYTAPGAHPVDVAVTGPALDGCNVYYTVYGPGGDEIGSGVQDSNRVSHVTFTAPDAARYLVQMYHSNDCIPAHWQLEIGPADSLTSSPPGSDTPIPTSNPTPSTSAACSNARARVNRDLRNQRSLKRQIRHAHGSSRRRLARRLRQVRRDLHVAVGNRRLHCG